MLKIDQEVVVCQQVRWVINSEILLCFVLFQACLTEFYEYLFLENQLVTGQILVIPQHCRVLRFYSWFTVYKYWGKRRTWRFCVKVAPLCITCPQSLSWLKMQFWGNVTLLGLSTQHHTALDLRPKQHPGSNVMMPIALLGKSTHPYV